MYFVSDGSMDIINSNFYQYVNWCDFFLPLNIIDSHLHQYVDSINHKREKLTPLSLTIIAATMLVKEVQ